ncbi:MAG: TonB-dependent siderophore receptor [Methylibium sp.]|uniref:TonB-dependent siderophore receptor n=1 Tax=Methylibium sp. TaxID=2067992 RepID=UPI0017D3564F|nr:TonB-dependent siderophore receptor [Methylibium sp.]MBA3597493.1 TonB-dependent siderophore receptor [Methylibium sp.]
MASPQNLHDTHARLRRGAVAIVCAGLAGIATAQADKTSLPPVTITGRSTLPPSDVAGFGDVPPERLPMQVLSIGEAQLEDYGAQGLRELTRFDASVSDAYNSVGYWDSLTVRGFVIDQRYNYRRDGVPITGETALALDNKSRLELLKGTSGIQAGTSAPGGLVNLVVKRPDVDVRSATLELRGAGAALAATDLSARFGEQRAFGLRVNAAVEHLHPELHDASGKRHLLAVAGDWRLSPDTLIEAEVETSRRSQPSQPGFSLLGDRVPDANDIDPRINLNNQPWSQPVVFAGRYASLRLTQKLNPDWRAVVHVGTQRLTTDDRLAFPFGCSDDRGTPDLDDDIYYADSYCPDGRFDLYDYRSENERRRTDAIDASVQGRLQTGSLTHALSVGVLQSRFEASLQRYAFNIVDIQGTIDGETVTGSDDSVTTDNTNRDERNTEFYLRDAIQLSPTVSLWLGLRHTRIERESITTSGTGATRYRQNFTTPWLAGSWTVMPGGTLYASWGEGIESEVVPGLPQYRNAGQALPALKSRQTELGFKHAGDDLSWGVAAFEISRPSYTDAAAICLAPSECSLQRASDGEAVHRGLEAQAQARLGAWTLGGSAMLLRARIEGSVDPALAGGRPANVPARSLRLFANHRLAALPGVDTHAALTAESERNVLPGNGSPRIPGWARIDVGASYDQHLAGGQRLVWRAGIDNLADRRAWKEAPYQFDHAYLYPMAPRTWRLSVTAEL